MARTMTVNKGGGGASYGEGWKTLTISRAAYGVFNDAKYLDIWFEGYPENFNARIYAKVSNGEEWAIGQVFRFANAGITGGLEGTDGKMVIKMDDSPIQLQGKQVNAYLYKDGKYSRILKQFAPTTFTNVAETFSEEDVTYWKGKAIKFFEGYVKPKLENSSDENTEQAGFVSSNATTETGSTTTNADDVIPF
jgi:hypothetical protein